MRAALATALLLVTIAALAPSADADDDGIPCLDTSAMPGRPDQAVGAAPCGLAPITSPASVSVKICPSHIIIDVDVDDPTGKTGHQHVRTNLPLPIPPVWGVCVELP